jgi:hypothetical protein
MYYITDYITKYDFKTHQMLSLLSDAVTKTASLKIDNPVPDAKLLLHKCMSQLSGKAQVHAQQAVRFLRGFGDGEGSHKTVLMLSSLAVYEYQRLHQNGMITEETSTNIDDMGGDVL